MFKIQIQAEESKLWGNMYAYKEYKTIKGAKTAITNYKKGWLNNFRIVSLNGDCLTY